MIRVCYDTVINSGLVTGDLNPPEEMKAVHEIEHLHDAGLIKRVKTEQANVEEKRTNNQARREMLEAARDYVSVVQPIVKPIPFSTQEDDDGSFRSSPPLTDIIDREMFDTLRTLGLKEGDAKHLTYAVKGDRPCDYFITLDTKDLLPHKAAIEAAYSIRVMKPTTFVQHFHNQAASQSVSRDGDPVN